MRHILYTAQNFISSRMLMVSIRSEMIFDQLESVPTIKWLMTYGQQFFTVVAILFFTRAFELESLFNASEGEVDPVFIANPLESLISLSQHVIFLISLFLLAIQGKSTLQTIARNKFIWPLILMVLVSFRWSDFPAITQPRSLAFLETCTFGLYLATKYTLKEQLRLLLYALGIVTLFSLLFSVVIPSRAIEMGIHAGDWRGPFRQKNLFARVLVLSTVAALCCTPQHQRERYFLLGILGLSFGLVLMSGSRTALGVAILLVALRQLYQAFRWKATAAIPLFLTIALCLVCISALGVNLITEGTIDLSGRLTIWSALMDKIQLRPWLGYGYLGFWHGIYGESAYVGKVYGTTYIPPHSHNGFFELILALGLWGVLFFCLSFISTARRALISATFTRSNEGLWPMMYLSFIILYNQTESTLVEHNSIFWVLYVSLALSKFISDREWQDGLKQRASLSPRASLSSRASLSLGECRHG